jgi:hypothetical protein
MGAAAFWVSLAAFLIAAMYFRSRSETAKHETLRQIVEKTGRVEEGQFKSLFDPPPPNAFTRIPPPGGGYRAMRVFGLLLIFISAGLFVFFTILGSSGAVQWYRAEIGYGAASVVALLGAGLFLASRFLPPPQAVTEGDRQAR